MKPPPQPLIPSGLSDRCTNVIGRTLLLRCVPGWGWVRIVNDTTVRVEDPRLCYADIAITVHDFVHFTTPHSGILGTVEHPPVGYEFKRFVAYIMSDGTDFDFTDQVASAWRVILGNGPVDYESAWCPIMSDPDAIYGYGTIALNAHYLALHQATYTRTLPAEDPQTEQPDGADTPRPQH
jgi:hypothetical protein